MSRNITALLSLTLALSAAPAFAAPATRAIEGFKHPESVLIDHDRRFVSNIGEALDPTGHDGDGFISELDADGNIVALRAFPGDGPALDAPKGMAMLSGRLYVADIDRIVGFDLATRKQVFEARVPDGAASLLNDVAVADDALIASDTLRGAVYRVDVDSGTFADLAEGIAGANGLVWDAGRRRILVVGIGAAFDGGDLYAITEDGAPQKLDKGPHGLLDGVALLSDGSLLVSDWISLDPPTAGTITLRGADGTTVTTVDTGRAIIGPADFSVDTAEETLWIPATAENAVVIAPLKR